MLRSDADAPKPPAYPFITLQFQRARTQNLQHTRTSGVTAVVPPISVTMVSPTAPRHFRSAFPLLFRFGEPVSTETARCPQEEKDDRRKLFAETGKDRKILGLSQESAQGSPVPCNFVSHSTEPPRVYAAAGRRLMPLGSNRNASNPTASPE